MSPACYLIHPQRTISGQHMTYLISLIIAICARHMMTAPVPLQAHCSLNVSVCHIYSLMQTSARSFSLRS